MSPTPRRAARGDLPSQILTWLAENPGPHRARDVAAGLTSPATLSRAAWSQKVANALGRLHRAGEVTTEAAGDEHGRPGGHPLRLYRTTEAENR